MNIQTLKAELSKVEKRRARLEKQIKSRTAKQYAALPARVGLKSIDALILSLAPYASPRLRSRLGATDGSSSAGTNGSGGARTGNKSKGTRYGAAVKAAVKAAMAKGGKTAAELSKEYGPSVFSINDWKKQWGFTKARKKK